MSKERRSFGSREKEHLTSERDRGFPLNDQAVLEAICAAKAIFFDHNDTLVSAMKAKWAQHKYIARKFYGKKLTDGELLTHWGQPATRLLTLLYGTGHIDIAMSYNIATRDQFPTILFKDTLQTLKIFRKMGKKIGLLTATTLSALQYDFAAHGIRERYFDYIQTEDDTIFHKPDPRVFDPTVKWLRQQQIEPLETVYIGDHLRDLLAAKGAGLKFIGVTTGLVSAEEFIEHQVPFIHQLSDLYPK